MRNIIYTVSTSYLPVNVNLTSNNVDLTNSHTENGEYSFFNVPVGEYVLTVTDSEGCEDIKNVDIEPDFTVTCNVSITITSNVPGEISVNNITVTNPSSPNNKFILYVKNDNNEIVFYETYASIPIGNNVNITGLDGGIYEVIIHDLTTTATVDDITFIPLCVYSNTINVEELIPCNLNFQTYEGCTNIQEESYNIYVGNLTLSNYPINERHLPKTVTVNVYEFVGGNEIFAGSFILTDNRYTGTNTQYIKTYLWNGTISDIGKTYYFRVTDETSNSPTPCQLLRTVTISGNINC